MTGLTIPTDGELDFLALGALVHRLDPGVIPFQAARQFDIHVSGGEYNVAANLSSCFGKKSGVATALVRYPIGDMIDRRVREQGVKPIYKVFKHDGVTGPNMATVFSDRGYGPRAPVVFYNRANEAAALLKTGDFDWARIFAGGVRWFHSGGIFAALSETTPKLILEGMEYARKAGAIISFDLNIRPKLWQIRGGLDEARNTLRTILPQVDVLVGIEPVVLHSSDFSRDGSDQISHDDTIRLIQQTMRDFPNLKVIAASKREIISTNLHRWSAVANFFGKVFESPVRDIDIYDRIGSGDGFAAGLFYGLLEGQTPQKALDLGWALGALVASTPGDTALVTAENVFTYASGGVVQVSR